MEGANIVVIFVTTDDDLSVSWPWSWRQHHIETDPDSCKWEEKQIIVELILERFIQYFTLNMAVVVVLLLCVMVFNMKPI